jgi:hypothetical protein
VLTAVITVITVIITAVAPTVHLVLIARGPVAAIVPIAVAVSSPPTAATPVLHLTSRDRIHQVSDLI